MKTLIKNGRVFDPSQNLDAVMDILVEDGKIKAVATGITEAADEVYDATSISFDKYYNGTEKSWDVAFNKIGGICYNRKVGRTAEYYAKPNN